MLLAQYASVSTSPVAGAIVAGVQDDGKDRFSPPIDLYQGGRGFTGYLPVHRQGELVAILNPVFRIPTLVEPILKRGDLTEVYSIALSGSDRPVYESLLRCSSRAVLSSPPSPTPQPHPEQVQLFVLLFTNRFYSLFYLTMLKVRVRARVSVSVSVRVRVRVRVRVSVRLSFHLTML